MELADSTRGGMSGEEQSGDVQTDFLAGAALGAAQPPWQESTRMLLFGAQTGCLWSILLPALWSQHFPGTGAGSWETPG